VTVWDERYCATAAATNSTTKQAEIVRLALEEGLIRLRPVAFQPEAAWKQIATVHHPDYVRAVRTGEPRSLAESQGFSWSPEFAASVVRIWAGHLCACRLALTERVVLHPVSGAHHARPTIGGGFCTFNFLVGAARGLLQDDAGLRRVAIVDLDAHPGDGTFLLVKDDRRVALFDVAYSSWVSVGNVRRIAYHQARDASRYRAELERLPAFLDAVRPGLVQYQAGVDCFERDPIGGVPGVNGEFLRWRDEYVIQTVRGRDIPLVVNLAGGYVEGTSERLHVQTIRAMARVARST
jgi:acetoin utilization deacetylase AcuC-like enzyme